MTILGNYEFKFDSSSSPGSDRPDYLGGRENRNLESHFNARRSENVISSEYAKEIARFDTKKEAVTFGAKIALSAIGFDTTVGFQVVPMSDGTYSVRFYMKKEVGRGYLALGIPKRSIDVSAGVELTAGNSEKFGVSCGDSISVKAGVIIGEGDSNGGAIGIGIGAPGLSVSYKCTFTTAIDIFRTKQESKAIPIFLRNY